MAERREKVLFVTGKLAEPSLRRVLNELASKVEFEAEIAVLPITVAALLTTKWIASHLVVPEGTDRVVLPGLVRGELELVPKAIRGPKDLRDIPEFFGQGQHLPDNYGAHDIAILGEINHAPKLQWNEILAIAESYRDHGADIIDLGCDPGPTWAGVASTVQALKAAGFRVSIDSFNTEEVTAALEAGAELVLSVNSSNCASAREWNDRFPNVEVVAIPDTTTDLDSFHRTIEFLQRYSIRHRLDPILEPIGFGFAASLGRYLEVRKRYPNHEMLMGIGNLTELTDADSAGINVLLAGFCQEVGIRSVLTTQVINWARSSIREFALARRLVYHAVNQNVIPKRLEPDLILLRDPKLQIYGESALQELARGIVDRNYRIFAERGEIHVMNGSVYVRGTDPFELFELLLEKDDKLDASHAFYLGYELAKAVTALTLHKNYVQDQALRWGFLTIPETSHRNPGSQGL